jgi:hypothetical protein
MAQVQFVVSEIVYGVIMHMRNGILILAKKQSRDIILIHSAAAYKLQFLQKEKNNNGIESTNNNSLCAYNVSDSQQLWPHTI